MTIGEEIVEYVAIDMGKWTLEQLAAGKQKEEWAERINGMIDKHVTDRSHQAIEFLSKEDRR